MKTLEEELASKAEKIKLLEAKLQTQDSEKLKLESMLKDMKKTIDRVSKSKTVQQLETSEVFDDYSDPVS